MTAYDVKARCDYFTDEGEVIIWRVLADATEEMTAEEAAFQKAYNYHWNRYGEAIVLISVTAA